MVVLYEVKEKRDIGLTLIIFAILFLIFGLMAKMLLYLMSTICAIFGILITFNLDTKIAKFLRSETK